QQILRTQGVHENAYSLNGPRDEAYCLEAASGQWSVYYCERGLKSGARTFTKKSDAYDYLQSLLTSDPTVYSPRRSTPNTTPIPHPLSLHLDTRGRPTGH